MRTIIDWPRRQKRSLQITVDVDVDLIEKAGVATIADELVEASAKHARDGKRAQATVPVAGATIKR